MTDTKMNTNGLGGLEMIGYYTAVVLTLGWLWIAKVVIKKAIHEATRQA